MPDDTAFLTTELADATEHDALVHQRRDRDVPPVADTADALGVGDARVGEEDLVELGFAGHLPERSHLDTLLVHVDVEVRQAPVLRARRDRCARAAGPSARRAPCSSRPSGRSRPTRRRRARPTSESDATSDPAPGSLNIWHQISSQVNVGRSRRRLLLLGAERDQRGAGHPDAHHVAQQVLRRVGGDQPLVDEILEAGVEAEAALPLREVDPREPEVELRAPEFLLRSAEVLGQQALGAGFDVGRRSLRPLSVALGGAMGGTLTCAYSPQQPWQPPSGDAWTRTSRSRARSTRPS